LASSHNYSEVAHFADHGIEVSGEVKVNRENDCSKTSNRRQTSGGVKYLMDKNKVTVLKVWVLLLTLLMLLLQSRRTSETVEAKTSLLQQVLNHLLFAFIKIDKERIITSTGALKLKEVPKHLLLVVV
jgi:dihydrolipoamide dehydrogenase